MSEHHEVMIELAPPAGVAPHEAASWAAHFAAPGVTFLEQAAAVPMAGGTVIVRAEVDSDEHAMALEGRPEVVKVWKDTPIAPFERAWNVPEQPAEESFDDDVEDAVEIVDPLAGDSAYESGVGPRLAGDDPFALDDVDESNLGF